MVLWLDPTLSEQQLNEVYSEVVACVPAEYNPECHHENYEQRGG